MISKYQPLIDKVLSHKDNSELCTKSADILLQELLDNCQVPESWKNGQKWDLTLQSNSELLEDVKTVRKLLTCDLSFLEDWPNNVPDEYLSENLFPITVLRYLLSYNHLPVLSIDATKLSTTIEFNVRFGPIISNAVRFSLNQVS